ncbi:MAG: hypothetical protein WAR79_16940 [Melioribacteraceae bacterium]
MHINFTTKVWFILLLITFISCSGIEINSKWREKDIIVDGNKKDWERNLNYFEDEKVAIGVLNDSENIYLCLTTSDRSKVMKILNNGFTIWFDSQNSDEEMFGIQYPIKKDFDDEMNMMIETKGRNDLNERNNKSRPNEDFPNRMIERLKAEQNEILIVNEDNFPLNVYKLRNDSGLEISVNIEQNQFVYELKIPFAENKSRKVYVNAFPNEELNLGFATGEMKKPEFEAGPGGNKKGGMRTPDEGDEGMTNSRKRDGGGMGGGRGEGNMSDLMKPIELDIKILLASKN